MTKRRGSGKPAQRRPPPPTTPTGSTPPHGDRGSRAFGREPLGMGCPVFAVDGPTCNPPKLPPRGLRGSAEGLGRADAEIV